MQEQERYVIAPMERFDSENAKLWLLGSLDSKNLRTVHTNPSDVTL